MKQTKESKKERKKTTLNKNKPSNFDARLFKTKKKTLLSSFPCI